MGFVAAVSGDIEHGVDPPCDGVERVARLHALAGEQWSSVTDPPACAGGSVAGPSCERDGTALGIGGLRRDLAWGLRTNGVTAFATSWCVMARGSLASPPIASDRPLL